MSTQQDPRTRCCATGRPILTDTISGSTICSCQLQSGLPSYLSRVPSLQPETLYGHGIGGIQNPSSMSSSSEFHLKHSKYMHTGNKVAMATEYNTSFGVATHPYNAFFPMFDIHGSRRKNATRESTGALKAWLYQHRKNPYPSKGEKVMLAIISQMTMTQVSTWFANARRRLKKEKVIDSNDTDIEDIDIEDEESLNQSIYARLSEAESDIHGQILKNTKVSEFSSDLSDCEDQRSCGDTDHEKSRVHSLHSPDVRNKPFIERIRSPILMDSKMSEHSFNSKETSNATVYKGKESVENNNSLINEHSNLVQSICGSQKNQTKPKIWSIAQLIG